MKVTEHLESAKNPFISFEIIPPKRGGDIQSLLKLVDDLAQYKPPFIDITSHAAEVVYEETSTGLKRKTKRKRPGTLGICALIQKKYNIDAVPHILCKGFTREETEDLLIDLQYLGIDNVLALRGDPIPGEKHYVPERGGHAFAASLVRQIANLNKGNYLHEEIENESKSNFCVGVAGYPEKHFEAINMKTDLRYLKEKVDAGADYIITQIFYDNSKYFDFVKTCRAAGINVPIIPGIKPITRKTHVQFIPKTFNIDFPDALGNQLDACTTDSDVHEVGVNWTVKQAKELIDFGVPVIHFYTMGRSKAVREIASQVF